MINRSVEFENYIPKLAFLSDRDRKHITWGVEHKAHLIAVSYIRDKENIKMIKDFLKDIDGSAMKIIAKIETKDAIENIEEIIKATDGVILNRVKLALLVGEKKAEKIKKDIIKLCHMLGKPILMIAGMEMKSKKNHETLATVLDEMKDGVDSFILTKETAVAEDPIDTVTMMYELVNNPENKTSTSYKFSDMSIDEDKDIMDYIIYNAYRASKEMDIKAIICPTES